MGDSTSFSTQFPDTPADVLQFETNYTKYIQGTTNGDSNALLGNISGLTNIIQSLQSFQSNIITSTPEYADSNASSMFLSNISTASVQTSTLQTKLDIVHANLQNKEPSGHTYHGITMPKGLIDIIEYTFMGATILSGILCIFLITYLVFTYMGNSNQMMSAITNRAQSMQATRKG